MINRIIIIAFICTFLMQNLFSQGAKDIINSNARTYTEIFDSLSKKLDKSRIPYDELFQGLSMNNYAND